MSMDHLLRTVRSLDGVLELDPAPGSAFPEIAWGDLFYYYAPDGRVPERQQPFATVVTKDYPGDTASDLDRPGRQRLNIHVGSAAFADLLGEQPRGGTTAWDHSASDVLLPHPLYRAQGWVAIVDPGPRTQALAGRLLRRAHADAVRRAAR